MRAAVDAGIETLLEAAAGFAVGSAHPDPAAAPDFPRRIFSATRGDGLVRTPNHQLVLFAGRELDL
ncbi:hypothetical protein [Kribbella amoyensis]|uniref:hypothetical protein n=1 Tax=Kribbella amoyensis TaxID=996641 RepID=UPI00192DDEAA|nr:hypothetical protein [Kribbella amoyensis]